MKKNSFLHFAFTTIGCAFVSTSFACNCAVIVATANAVAVGIGAPTGCADANKPSGGVIAFPTRKCCPAYQTKRNPRVLLLTKRMNIPPRSNKFIELIASCAA